jgi:hypothetical protein
MAAKVPNGCLACAANATRPDNLDDGESVATERNSRFAKNFLRNAALGSAHKAASLRSSCQRHPPAAYLPNSTQIGVGTMTIDRA